MPPTSSELTDARRRELGSLTESLGHTFADLTLLDRALCHSSTGNERKTNYERLEFLGDAILGFLVADALFRQQPEIPVGELTDRRAQLVSRAPLAEIARELDLGRYLVGGRGLLQKDRLSPRILADLVEATIAAIYLDGGIEPASAFVSRNVLTRIAATTGVRSPERDPKSRLLHFAQMLQLGQPNYRVVSTSGPDHERVFEVAVVVNDRQVAQGQGRSKQLAEKRAAETALVRLQAEASASGAAEDSDGATGRADSARDAADRANDPLTGTPSHSSDGTDTEEDPDSFGAGTGWPGHSDPSDADK